jgi:hypothetical protein
MTSRHCEKQNNVQHRQSWTSHRNRYARIFSLAGLWRSLLSQAFEKRTNLTTPMQLCGGWLGSAFPTVTTFTAAALWSTSSPDLLGRLLPCVSALKQCPLWVTGGHDAMA